MFAFGALKAMIDLYDLGFVQFPVAVAISMHQVRGCFLDKKKWPFMSSPSECAIDDDHVLVDPIVVVEKPDDPKSALRPLFDIIWNAFGYPRCYLYDEHGNYVV